MHHFFRDWRRRLVVHAMLLFAVAGVVGFTYLLALGHDDVLECQLCVSRVCDPWDPTPPVCAKDHPCKNDTFAEHRLSSAHQQAWLHGLLLLAIAFAGPYLRVGRLLFAASAWLLIVGSWGATLAASIDGEVTFWNAPPFAGDPLFAGLTRLVATLAGLATMIAMLILVGRSAWEFVRAGIAPQTWWNRARIASARPRRLFEPETLEELLDDVQEAMRHRMHVRAFGGRYSWSAIATTDDAMIDMRELRAIAEPVPFVGDPEASHTVTVQAGATIRELSDFLAERGLMLETTPVNPWIQVGGALALGCHGTGIHHRALTELVTGLTIVQYNATPLALLVTYLIPVIPRPAPAWEQWDALMVNLGCLGVMFEITLKCRKLYDVRIVDQVVPMDFTINTDAQLIALIQGGGQPNYSSEIFWFPYNEQCYVRTWHESTSPSQPGFGFWFWALQWLYAKVAGPVVFTILTLAPYLTPFTMRLFHSLFGNLAANVPAPEAMQYQRYFLRVFDVGHAIPISLVPGGFDAFRAAWFEIVNRLEAYRNRAIYPQNSAVHVRFGRGAHALLAPNGGGPSQHWAFIEIITHANTPLYAEHFEVVEEAWYRLGGRAHWGKMTYDVGALLTNYAAADVTTFLGVRAAMDPDEVFLNDYVREALQL